MLRFFRQVRKNLVAQENARRYFIYAIGEILLVVVGILIALQVNNWNEQRLDTNRGQEYLNRLLENLEEDKKIIQIRITFIKEVERYAKLAISHAENTISDEVSEWDILLAYFQSSQIWPLELTDVTYDELKNSGEIKLIKDYTLRKELSTYYGEQYNQYKNTIGVLPAYREKIRGLIPFDIQGYIWGNCHGTSGTKQVLIECSAPNNKTIEEIAANNAEIEQNEIVKDLRFWASNMNAGLNILEAQKELCDKLIELINELEEIGS